MNWYLAIRRGVQPPADERVIERHLEWMRAQHDAGVILISGPSSDYSMSLCVLRASSRQAAAEIAAQDPLAQDEDAATEIIEWEVHQVLGIGPFDLASTVRQARLNHPAPPE